MASPRFFFLSAHFFKAFQRNGANHLIFQPEFPVFPFKRKILQFSNPSQHDLT